MNEQQTPHDGITELCRRMVNKRVRYKGTNANEYDTVGFKQPLEGTGTVLSVHTGHGLYVMIRTDNGTEIALDPIDMSVIEPPPDVAVEAKKAELRESIKQAFGRFEARREQMLEELLRLRPVVAAVREEMIKLQDTCAQQAEQIALLRRSLGWTLTYIDSNATHKTLLGDGYNAARSIYSETDPAN